MAVYGVSMASYKKAIRFGPTYRFVHKDCGHRVKRIELRNSYCYQCEHCEKTISKHLAQYAIDKVKVA